MDLTGLVIGVGLVFTGAYFIGYPIGKIIGGRQACRVEETSVPAERPMLYKPAWYKTDILDAEILEEKR